MDTTDTTTSQEDWPPPSSHLPAHYDLGKTYRLQTTREPRDEETVLTPAVLGTWIGLTFIDTRTGEKMAHNLYAVQLFTLWNVYRAVQRLGRDETVSLLWFGQMLAGPVPHIPLDRDDTLQIIHMMEAIEHMAGIQPKDEEETLLAFCYALLKDKTLTHAQAAEFATWGKQTSQPITPDAWRRRIARWAKTLDLPPVALTRGRPPKKNPSI